MASYGRKSLAGVIVLSLLAYAGYAELGLPPSQRVDALDAVALADGVHLRWKSAPDPSVMAFRMERSVTGSTLFAPLKPCALVYPPLAGDAWSCDIVDPVAVCGTPVSYRLAAIRKDGREAEVGLFSLTPHPPATSLQAEAAGGEAAPDAVVVATGATVGRRVKILTGDSGLYGISASALSDCLEGLSPDAVTAAIAAGALRLWSGTNELAWMAAPGNTGLWFFAQSEDSIYTTSTVSWVEQGAGKVMAQAPVTVPGQPWGGASVTLETVHLERDTAGYYNNDVFSDPEADVWFWGGIASSQTQTTFSLVIPGVVTGTVAGMTVNMKGATQLANAPEHHAKCFVNGVLAGTADWDGYAESHPVFAVSNLVEGTNTVLIQGYAWPGDLMSIFYIDSFDVTYARYHRAVADQILCAADSNGVQRLEGFTATNVWVFDVTDATQPVCLTGAQCEVTNGSVRVSFEGRPEGRRYLAAAAPRAPSSVRGRPLPHLCDATNHADYVALTPASLAGSAADLATYRRSRGWDVSVVDVEDVFDEFGAGIPTPHAIRGFVGAASQWWSVKPRFLALLGTGTWNYRGISGQSGNPNYIPTIRVATPYGLCGSDTPLGDINGDHIPEIAVGRLPVVTTGDLSSVVLKIQAYENSVTNLRSVSVMAGTINPSDGINFPGSSDTLFPLVAATYQAVTNYYTPAGQKQRLQTTLFGGVSFLTYVGHANEVVLDNGSLLSASDLTWMTNAMAPPLLVMACVFGRFDKPAISTEGLAQRMVRRGGGGFAAVWGCSATTENDDNVALGQWMVRACFRRNGITLGEAARQALVGYAGDARVKTVVMDTYTLLGDPALDMNVWNGDARSFDEWAQHAFSAEQLADAGISGALADPDGDGLVNRDEYRAGTGPLDPASRLAIIAFDQRESGRSLAWSGVPNRLYTVERTKDLTSTFAACLPSTWGRAATNNVSSLPDEDGGPWFYRIKLEE